MADYAADLDRFEKKRDEADTLKKQLQSDMYAFAAAPTRESLRKACMTFSEAKDAYEKAAEYALDFYPRNPTASPRQFAQSCVGLYEGLIDAHLSLSEHKNDDVAILLDASKDTFLSGLQEVVAKWGSESDIDRVREKAKAHGYPTRGLDDQQRDRAIPEPKKTQEALAPQSSRAPVIAAGFLHFTDFHQGIGGGNWLWPTAKSLIYADLEYLHEKTGPWRFVLFTGDLTQRASVAEFTAFQETLDKLWAHFRKLGSDPVLVAVPGNHDLVRPVADPDDDEILTPEQTALRRWEDEPKMRATFWKKKDSPYRKLIETAFANYASWWEACPYRPKTAYKTGLLPGEYSLTIQEGGLSLGFLGLNSAFLQLAGGEFYKGKLSLDAQQFHEACGGDGVDWVQRHDLAFLLTHHPPAWLDKAGQEALKTDIHPDDLFSVHFFGHMHEHAASSISVGGSGHHREVQGCSLLGLETYGNRQQRTHGYNAGRIEVQDDIARIRLWPRIWNKHMGGSPQITADTTFSLKGEEYRTPFEIRLRRALPAPGAPATPAPDNSVNLSRPKPDPR